jgi:dienelactone hydrolase
MTFSHLLRRSFCTVTMMANETKLFDHGGTRRCEAPQRPLNEPRSMMLYLVRSFGSLRLSHPAVCYLLALLVATAARHGCSSAFLLSAPVDPTHNTRNLRDEEARVGRCTRLAMAASADDGWSPLDPESLCSAPCLIEQTLCVEPDGGGRGGPTAPRLALDKSYASAVLDAWRQDEAAVADNDGSSPWTAEYKRVVYQGSDEQPLFGYVVRKQGGNADSVSDSSAEATPANDGLPGVLFFHTAAGPNDMFLLYKAAALVNTVQGGCVVLVADLLSDGTGWGWRPDKTRYQSQSKQVLQRVNGCGRLVLQDRITAAIRCLTTDTDVRVDRHNLAALGWCFGGHAIQELGLMQVSTSYSIRAMATFHGVFDASARLIPSSSEAKPRACEVLLCTGTDDPFVSSDMVEAALQGLQDSRHTVSLLQLRGARHGFSNPGQQHNANQESFGYDADAAHKSWRQTMALLHRRVVRP